MRWGTLLVAIGLLISASAAEDLTQLSHLEVAVLLGVGLLVIIAVEIDHFNKKSA